MTCAFRALPPPRPLEVPNPLALEPAQSTVVAMAKAEPERRPCSICGKPMKSNNTTDTHSACRAPAESSSTTVDAGPAQTLKQFRQVASALGFLPDQLLADFAQTWLEKLKKAVAP